MARRHALVKKFCRFNFVSISWKSNFGACSQDILCFFFIFYFLNDTALCLRSDAVWLSFFSFFSLFWSFFVCFLFTRVCRTQTPRRSWITYSFGSPKLIEFLSPFPFRKATRESKNDASPWLSKTICRLFILFSSLTVQQNPALRLNDITFLFT